jgi:hypothetical protein
MSGLDEQGIPECPNCKEKTNYWRVYKGSNSSVLVYFNYRRKTVMRNGEFNQKSSRSTILAFAKYMVCDSCGYIANGGLFGKAMNAFKYNKRRFPELVGT